MNADITSMDLLAFGENLTKVWKSKAFIMHFALLTSKDIAIGGQIASYYDFSPRSIISEHKALCVVEGESIGLQNIMTYYVSRTEVML